MVAVRVTAWDGLLGFGLPLTEVLVEISRYLMVTWPLPVHRLLSRTGVTVMPPTVVALPGYADPPPPEPALPPPPPPP